MKSISHGMVRCAHQVGHEEDGALQHADQEQVAPGVVGGDLLAQLGDPLLQRVRLDQDLGDAAFQFSLRSDAPPPPLLDDAREPRPPRPRAPRAARPRARNGGSWRPRIRPESSCCGPASRSPALQPRTLSPSARDRITQPPQRTSPFRSTGPSSSQSWSYSRTAMRPPPRSTRLEPAGKRAGRRAQAEASRACPARGGCSRPRVDAAGAAAEGSRRGWSRASCRRSTSRRETEAPRPRSTPSSVCATRRAADARRRRAATAAMPVALPRDTRR